MAKPTLTIVETTLSTDEIASALRLTPDQVVRTFHDPRVTNWFAEIWGERLFAHTKHLNSNHPGSDAAIGLGAIGRFDIAVRCFFANTIKFQKSKFIGSGRSVTVEDLVRSVEDVERYVLIDLRQFPKLRFIPLDTKALLRLIHAGKLTTTGISPKRLDAWLKDAFDLVAMPTKL